MYAAISYMLFMASLHANILTRLGQLYEITDKFATYKYLHLELSLQLFTTLDPLNADSF